MITGKWYINGYDLGTSFNMQVLKCSGWFDIPERKEGIKNDWPEINGVDIDEQLTSVSDRIISLDCAILARTSGATKALDVLKSKLAALMLELVKPGLITLYSVDRKESKQVYYQKSSPVQTFGRMDGEEVFAKVSITFIDNTLSDIPKAYPNVEKSGLFTKNDCGAGTYGSTELYVVPSGRYFAASQAAADALAQADVTANGQKFANLTGTCLVAQTYKYVRSQTFTRDNCGGGYEGTSVLFSKTYVSTVSLADAQAQAAADSGFTTEGQAFANLNGSCQLVITYTAYRTGTFTRNNCGVGYYASSVSFSKSYTSSVSQAAAEALAEANFATDGQAYANANGTCTIYVKWSSNQSTWRTPNISGVTTGDEVKHFISATGGYYVTIYFNRDCRLSTIIGDQQGAGLKPGTTGATFDSFGSFVELLIPDNSGQAREWIIEMDSEIGESFSFIIQQGAP